MLETVTEIGKHCSIMAWALPIFQRSGTGYTEIATCLLHADVNHDFKHTETPFNRMSFTQRLPAISIAFVTLASHCSLLSVLGDNATDQVVRRQSRCY